MNKNGYTANDDKKHVITHTDGREIEDVVYTSPLFAKKIIDYFSPQFKKTDNFIDPCKGLGAFYDHLPNNKDWCELQDGRDYLLNKNYYDWCIGNFPWRGSFYAKFNAHALQHSVNVVSLVKLFGALGTLRRLRDAKNANHYIKEVILVDWKDADFTYIDGTKKSAEGFVLSVCHWQKNWHNGTTWSDWTIHK